MIVRESCTKDSAVWQIRPRYTVCVGGLSSTDRWQLMSDPIGVLFPTFAVSPVVSPTRVKVRRVQR